MLGAANRYCIFYFYYLYRMSVFGKMLSSQNNQTSNHGSKKLRLVNKLITTTTTVLLLHPDTPLYIRHVGL